MNSSLTPEDRRAFVETVRRLLVNRSDERAVRAAMDTQIGYDQTLWRQLAELGIVGLIIDEVYGGTGLGAVELELVMEEVGAALLCSPLLSSGVFAASLLAAIGHTKLLPKIASGSCIATVALAGSRGGWTAADIEVEEKVDGLCGLAGFVTDAHIASVLLVVAKAADGVGIYEVPSGAPGLTIEPLPTFDRTRRLSRVGFDRVSGTRIGSGWGPVEHALDAVRVALAGEQAGGARAMLERTVNYAKSRYQFGRAIGSFQAIKHMAADLLLESESATSAARNAAEQFANNSEDASLSISLAAFVCADAFETTCATGIQMHGGIAFTWEHPAHLYLRRARSAAQLFGTPAFYRERFVQQLGG